MINFKEHLGTILNLEHVINVKSDVEDEFFRLVEKRRNMLDVIGGITLDDEDIKYLMKSNENDIYTVTFKYHSYRGGEDGIITVAYDPDIKNANCEEYFNGSRTTYRLTVNEIILNWIKSHGSFVFEGVMLRYDNRMSSAISYEVW